MPPVILPTDKKLCPFFKDVCKKQECALYLAGNKVCAVTATAVFAGDILGHTERRN
jgi:hypothetical protein